MLVYSVINFWKCYDKYFYSMNTLMHIVFQNTNWQTDIGYITPQTYAALLSEISLNRPANVLKVDEKAWMICSSSPFE